jgi:peptidoglycan/xylan/chitin deacetylase (PgdA/CDA1 family)
MSGLILLYHRIAHFDADPWSMCVTPECFSEQMEALRRITQPFSLAELIDAQQAGEVPDRAVAVTFDDGYLDNLTNAKPILERYEIPATVFVCSGVVGKNEELWWDDLERAFLQTDRKLRGQLVIQTANRSFHWDFEEVGRADEDDGASSSNGKSANELAFSNYMAVWEVLRPLRPEAQAAALRQIRAWAGLPIAARSTYRTMDADQIVALASGGLIDVGAHTMSHPLLPAHPRDLQRREILGSTHDLEQILGRPIQHFAYPYGEYDETTVDILRQTGLACALTTIDRAVSSQSSLYELPRMSVQNWGGDQFLDRIVRKLSPSDPMSRDLKPGERLVFPLSAFHTQTGHVKRDSLECMPGRDKPGHCLYGPDYFVAETGTYRVTFAMDAQEGDPDDAVFDVYENRRTRRVLAEGSVASGCRLGPSTLLLEFLAEGGHRVEFRTYWRGRSLLRIREVRLERLT